MLTSDAAKDLGVTSTSISRACRQLEAMKLIQTEKRSIQKVIKTQLSFVTTLGGVMIKELE